MRLRSKLLFVNIPADNPDETARFYSSFFGIDLVRNLTERPESYHAPIDEDGIDLNVTERQRSDEQMTCAFGVDDLDAAIAVVTHGGGRVVAGPFDVPVEDRMFDEYRSAQEEELRTTFGGRQPVEQVERSLGRTVVAIDPGGVPFALIELTEHAQRHYNFGRHQRELRADQVRIHERARNLGRRVPS
jgi:predicted enzyme related to lactoylglutathione lyase